MKSTSHPIGRFLVVFWLLAPLVGAQGLATLEFKPAEGLVIDGAPGDWKLEEFTSLVRAGESVRGDTALVGYHLGQLFVSGFATHFSLPGIRTDHTARAYGRHDAGNIYLLIRLDDEDVQTPYAVEMNWANDCVEIYIDPESDGGTRPLASSSSDVQLVIDAANQRNVYVTTAEYRERVLAGVRSATSRDASGWWLEVGIDKAALSPALPEAGSFRIDFNYRDNDGNNDPARTTVYTWSDGERSGSFPSKIPDRWGEASLPAPPPPLPPAAHNPIPADGATGVATEATLSWTAGSGANDFDIYVGTSAPPPFVTRQPQMSFAPSALIPDTTYLWRIDTVNDVGVTVGRPWRFTTGSEINAPTLEIRPGNITIDGNIEDWRLSELTRIVRAGDVLAGDVALVGFDSGTLHWSGRFTGYTLPTNAADHTARVYTRHSAEHLYVLIRLDDGDLQHPFGPEMNWANDSAEIFIDPSLDRGASPIRNSASDFQLVIDSINQVNVYMVTSAYRDQLLSGIDSAVAQDATGWWLELRIDKAAVNPPLSSLGSFGIDLNFRDNDSRNAPNESTVYSWSDSEQSGRFPSKIPNRWGLGRLLPPEPPLEPPPEPPSDGPDPANYVNLSRVEDIINGTSTQNLGLLHGMTFGVGAIRCRSPRIVLGPATEATGLRSSRWTAGSSGLTATSVRSSWKRGRDLSSRSCGRSTDGARRPTGSTIHGFAGGPR